MPKLKTNRGAAKRFRKTKTGKYKHAQQNRRHIMECKSAKRVRHLSMPAYVHPADVRQVRRLLPHL